MNLSDESKKIYELNFSIVKAIATMLFITHGTGLVTLFTTDAQKYKDALFFFGVGFMLLQALLVFLYLNFIVMIHSKINLKFNKFHKLSQFIMLSSLILLLCMIFFAFNKVFAVL